MILIFLSKNTTVESQSKREKIKQNHLEMNPNNNRLQENGTFNRQNFMFSFSKETKKLSMTSNIVEK